MALDGDYINLVEFILEAVQHLDKTYKPAQTWSERICEQVPQESETTTFSYGEEPVHVQVVHRIGFDPETLEHTEDDVLVACNGLSENMRLELQAIRSHNEQAPEDNRLMTYLGIARAAVKLKAWRAAEFNAQQALQHDPNNPEALVYLGLARATV